MAEYISKYKGTEIDALLDTINGADSNIQIQINDVQEQVESVQTEVESKQEQHSSSSVLLSASGWVDNSQTINVSKVTATNTIIVSPAPESRSGYAAANVFCSAQGEGTLTFICEEVPTESLAVNLVIL